MREQRRFSVRSLPAPLPEEIALADKNDHPGQDHTDEETIRVLLLDDCTITRIGMRAIMNDYADIDIIADASDCEVAVQQINEIAPDVVVVNTLASSLDAKLVMDRLAVECPHWPGRILAIVGGDSGVNASTGTVGTLMRRATAKELVLALRMVATGYSLFPSSNYSSSNYSPNKSPRPSVELVDAALSTGPLSTGPLELLTQREYDVLRLLAQGCTNAEISARLVLSESTVKSHVQHLLTKLGMRNRVRAAIYAYEAGIVPTERKRVS